MTIPAEPSADGALMARLGRALAPAYEMEGEIGRGGMAVVYRARDTRLKRAVAVKLLPPELAFRADIRTRFLREAETAARLGHPNIVPIYAVDERDGLVYFVMALVRGESVGGRLLRAGPFPIPEARRILREVADALAFAHRSGVVHRDIKPDNVLLDGETGRAMVTDFGIARAASEEGGGSRLTATGAAIGTPAYMSPEQCVGDREIDGRSDLYSLGTVAYEMLTGAPPFSGMNTPSMMMKQVTELPVPVRQRRGDVPEELERIVMKLLEKDPADRFADGAELVAALDGAPVAPPRRATSVAKPAPTKPAPTWTSPPVPDDIATWSRRDIRQEARRTAREIRRHERPDHRSIVERMRAARRHLVSYAGTSVMLFSVNAMTSHGFWWCVFPILGMGLGVAKEIGGFWADGVPLRSILSGTLPEEQSAAVEGARAFALPAPSSNDELLRGPHGDVLRQAMKDHRAIQDSLAKLSETERKVLPDIKGTSNALYERITSLAGALDRLHEQVDASRASVLDDRISELEGQSGSSADRDRRLGLLRRQRDMLADLVHSRGTLLEQYESAGLLLQNLALDLLKVRSSGLDSALGGLTSATQEARALSREIGYVLNAADELRDLEGKSGPAS